VNSLRYWRSFYYLHYSEMPIFLQVHFASNCTAISGAVVLEFHKPDVFT
jgi:hypothetical protein